MADETPPTDRKAELQALLTTEYRKRPWLVYCGFVCIGVFIAGFILSSVLQGRIPVTTRYYTMTALYFVGALAGTVGIFAAPQSIREHQKFLRWATVFNAAFFLLSGYRALVLLQLHHS